MRRADFFKPNVKKMKAEEDVEGLIKALSYKDSDVQSKIAVALGEIGKPVVEPLIHALKDEDSYARWGAAEALGKIGDERALEPLIHAFKDEDSGVREVVKEALKNIKAREN